jgi:hypothetical protein
MAQICHLFYGIIADLQTERPHHLFFKRLLKNRKGTPKPPKGGLITVTKFKSLFYDKKLKTVNLLIRNIPKVPLGGFRGEIYKVDENLQYNAITAPM